MNNALSLFKMFVACLHKIKCGWSHDWSAFYRNDGKIKPRTGETASCFGYTLVEVLVALTLFAVLATITSSILYRVFHTRTRVNLQSEQLTAMQFTYALIERDTEQLIERATIDKNLNAYPPFIGNPTYTEFTRVGVSNPEGIETRSALKRVAYVCTNHQLLRRTWPTLDTPFRADYQENTLLENVYRCSFAYLAHNRQLLKEWRPYALQQNQKNESIPMAIQVNLSIKHWGKINILFPLNGAPYAG